MLNRELLRFQYRNHSFYPRFLERGNPSALELANGLLGVYANASGVARGELETLASVWIQGARDRKLAEGFHKLILDHCKFSSPGEFDYPAERKKLFSGEVPDPAFVAGDIYGDLSDNETLAECPSFSADDLICRYNLALVQGLILSAEKLVLHLADPPAQELRKLLKYLKFFRLLAEIRQAKKNKSDFEIEISGPCSLLMQTRKYALQLALFFPAVVNLPRWSLEALLKSGIHTGMLHLDESAGLYSHYRHFSTYVPEEVTMFHHLFRKEVKEWEIVGECGFLNGGGQRLIFPDLSFRRPGDPPKKTIYMELFHRWHHGQLGERLRMLEQHPEMPLLLGIDRSIASDAEFLAITEGKEALAMHLFRFRDFPGVDRSARSLEKLRTALDGAVSSNSYVALTKTKLS